MSKPVKTIRTLAPEDIRTGSYIAVTHTLVELPSFLFNCATVTDASEPVRIRLMPWEAGKPLKVLEVCLPFLLVRQPDGLHTTLDTRRHRIARLSKRFARRVLAQLAADRAREKTEGGVTSE